MHKFLIILLVSSSFSSLAMAAVSGGCAGVHRGRKISFSFHMTNGRDKNTATGSISVGNREVAAFEGEDLKINFFFQTFKMTNNRGDLVDGKVTNILKKTGVMKRLYVRGYGIDYRNVPMRCWTN